MSFKRTAAIAALPVFLLVAGCTNREASQPDDSLTTRATRGAFEMAEDATSVAGAKGTQYVNDPAIYTGIEHGTENVLVFGENGVKAMGRGFMNFVRGHQSAEAPPVAQAPVAVQYAGEPGYVPLAAGPNYP